jgi:L-ascorbate metabolism protein UlaG (beta-lactamase superfamily)
MTLRMTGLGHACVRLETGSTTVVIDPGAFSDTGALDGADAVLITHEHFDHVVPDRLRAVAKDRPDLEVWTNPALAAQFADLGPRVHAVTHGDSFQVGDLEVHVYGEKHAVIHRDIPLVDNVGFFVGGTLFHPGDALTVPDQKVTTLLAPAGAPWMKLTDLVDYVRAVAPERSYLIHTAMLSELGLRFWEDRASEMAAKPAGGVVSQLPSGDRVELG